MFYKYFTLFHAALEDGFIRLMSFIISVIKKGEKYNYNENIKMMWNKMPVWGTTPRGTGYLEFLPYTLMILISIKLATSNHFVNNAMSTLGICEEWTRVILYLILLLAILGIDYFDKSVYAEKENQFNKMNKGFIYTKKWKEMDDSKKIIWILLSYFIVFIVLSLVV